MHNPDLNQPPLNPLPPVVVVFTLAIIGVELVLQGGARGIWGGNAAIGWRLEAITSYGFIDAVVTWMLDTGRYPAEHMMRFVTYPFIHGSLSHAVFTAVFIVALGKMVAEVFSSFAFVAIFFTSSIMGALAYWAFLDEKVALIGAYPAAYGMIGAVTYMQWVRFNPGDANRWRAFQLIGFLLGIQLFFKIVFGGGNDWVADIAGFAAGFALSIVLNPAGPARIQQWLAALRRR